MPRSFSLFSALPSMSGSDLQPSRTGADYNGQLGPLNVIGAALPSKGTCIGSGNRNERESKNEDNFGTFPLH